MAAPTRGIPVLTCCRLFQEPPKCNPIGLEKGLCSCGADQISPHRDAVLRLSDGFGRIAGYHLL
jgi:hypothetical protein